MSAVPFNHANMIPGRVLILPGSPDIYVVGRTLFACKCMIMVGYRCDNGEVAAAILPCDRHDSEIAVVKERYAEIPRSERLLLDVLEELAIEAGLSKEGSVRMTFQK